VSKAALLCAVLSSLPAHAYLDPGTGSFVLQMLFAAVIGALFAIKSYWYRLKAFVLKLLGRTEDDSESERPESCENDDARVTGGAGDQDQPR
jgi:hypothetical protein